MRSISVTTTRVLAMKALQRACGQDCVDWAIGLLENGEDARSVAILAGMTPPFNAFEMAELRDRVLQDLRIPEPPRAETITAYAGELAAQALEKQRDPFGLLRDLSDLCIAEGYCKDLYKCYQLYNAWEDLRYGGVQWYLHGVTLDNIEDLVREELARLSGSLRTTR